MTPPERKLWQVLRGEAVGVKFRRQHPIGPYIADFYSRDAQLVVEVDGALAHGAEEAVAHDRVRDAFMESLGLHVVRFTASEVERNLEGVLEAIRMASEEVRSPHMAEWVEARDLRKRDRVFFGPEFVGVRVENAYHELSEGEVCGLEVDGLHSFLTEVCAVHGIV